MKETIQIHPSDNVAVVLQPTGEIPAGHKVALRPIRCGEPVVKYGYPIGHATADIPAGAWVHEHNLATNLEGVENYQHIEMKPDLSAEEQTQESLTFQGYLRADGQAGIRNELWIIPTVGCVNGICQQLMNRFNQAHPDTAFCFTHPYGCSQLGEDHENTRKILRDMIHHPNAGGILVVGLGCENNQPRLLEAFCGDYDKERVRFMVCQEEEGNEIQKGLSLLDELYIQASRQERQTLPASLLRVGLKCGGSDGFSGITANPLVGCFSDFLCQEQGGTTLLAEVPEMFGAEHILMERSKDTEVLERTIRMVNGFKEYYLSHGEPVGENPSPGNKAGGITTLEEKALGCTQKAGSATVCGVLDYGDRLAPEARGLHLLSAPGNDLVAATALAAAGCQLVLFTTGRGTPFSTFVPTVKISTNNELAARKTHWVDFNAGTLLTGESMADCTSRFIQKVLQIASGEQTCAEVMGIHEIAIFKNGITL